MMRNKRKEPVGNLNCKNSCELVIRILNSLIKKKNQMNLLRRISSSDLYFTKVTLATEWRW